MHPFWPWQPRRLKVFVSSQQAAGELFGAIFASIFPFEAASKALRHFNLQFFASNVFCVQFVKLEATASNFPYKTRHDAMESETGTRPVVLICSYTSKPAVLIVHRYHVFLQTYMSKFPKTSNQLKHTTTKYPNHPYLLNLDLPKTLYSLTSLPSSFSPPDHPPFRISVCCQRQGRLPQLSCWGQGRWIAKELRYLAAAKLLGISRDGSDRIKG